MTETTPVEPTTISATEPTEPTNTAPQQAAQQPQTPPGEDWKKRYDGSVRKIEELVTTNRQLQADLEAKTSQIEQLQSQLSLKDTEKDVAVRERDKNLQDALATNQEMTGELESLRALKLKLEVAKELNRPELIRIVGNIPDLTDKEALTTVMKDFAGFADDLVKQREAQLLAGVTPPVSPGGTSPSSPQTSEAWTEKINNLPLGSKERSKAMDEYGDWLQKQHTQQ